MSGSTASWYDEWVYSWDDAKSEAWVAAKQVFDAATYGTDDLLRDITQYLQDAERARAALDLVEPMLVGLPPAFRTQHAALLAMWKELIAPILVDSEPAPSLGNPFVPVLVIGGLALGAWACAYAVAHLADAAAAWRHAEAFQAEATQRYKLAEQGKPVPPGPNSAPWNAPPKPPGGDDELGIGGLVTGLGALIALGVAANALSSMRSR